MDAEHPLPTYRCPHVGVLEVNGDLRKPQWSAVPRVRLISATGRKQKLQPTTFRACWDRQRLYLSYHCRDTDVRATFTNRDERLYDEDVVEAFLCPTGDLAHYFELEFSPRNVIFDARVNNPHLDRSEMTVDTAWNCEGIQTAVRLSNPIGVHNPGGWWDVEVGIPFAGLSAPAPSPGDRWRANFFRIDYETPTEYSAWSPTLALPPNFHLPTHFGWLEFVSPGQPS